ncbi:MAG TPA: hypothetical protein VN965_06505 [Candidatus Dormibacteraeota bacterium]|jgi:hypothetical protein|nr:hypothetical protein [Candidatus Dormibacteraeota bacterium]
MGYLGLVLALFTLGYILGVWTAFLVLKQPQRAYEDTVPAPRSDVPVIVLRNAANLGNRPR